MNTNIHDTEELEAKLLSRFGAERPFSVPQGYFDELTERVMSRMPQQKASRRSPALRWAAAAALAGCVAAGGLLYERLHDTQTAEADEMQYIEEALDYSMIDNMSIASYLTEAE